MFTFAYCSSVYKNVIYSTMVHVSRQIEELTDHLRNGTTFKNIKRIPRFRKYIDDGTISYRTRPFEAIVFQSLFSNKIYVESLFKEVDDMVYIRKASDLYCFEQSKDFHDQMDLGPSTRIFLKIMYETLKPLIESIYGFTCNRISIAASRYKQKDYLLCHDDKCSDRHVAFIYYLCPNWEESDGGLLCLYSHDKCTKEPTRIMGTFIPQMNNFLIFKVGTTTYHEVSEVTAENKERYTINGWFHSPAALEEQSTHQLFNPVDPLLAIDSSNEAIKFAECLSPLYCRKTVMKGINKEYKKQSSVLLPNFLEHTFFNHCINELTDAKLEWKCVGPPNQRRYEVATFEVNDPWQRLPENLGKLVVCLTAPNFFDYVECLTGENLSGQEVNVDGRAFGLQLQRWSGGCYSLLSDNNVQNGLNMLDLNLFLKVDDDLAITGDQGSVSYSSDRINVIGQPSCNSLFIVNNEENTGRYVKYINTSQKKAYIYVMYITCMCIKNTVSTLAPTSVEEKFFSDNIISAGKTEHNLNESQFDCDCEMQNSKRTNKNKKTTNLIATEKTSCEMQNEAKKILNIYQKQNLTATENIGCDLQNEKKKILNKYKKQNLTAIEKIGLGNIHCKDRKIMTGKIKSRNIFIVSKNKSKNVSKEKQTIKNNFSNTKINSNGNTFIVTEIVDSPKKKRKEEESCFSIACH